jgi:hypothetical protein
MITVLLVILVILLIGGAPGFGFHQAGWGPSGIVGVLLVVLLVLLLMGRI